MMKLTRTPLPLNIIELNSSIKATKIKKLSRKVNDRLSFIECRRRHINVEGHLPVGRADGLMKAKPNLTPSSQWMIVVCRGREEGSSNGSVQHGVKMPKGDVDGESSIVRNISGSALNRGQELIQ